MKVSGHSVMRPRSPVVRTSNGSCPRVKGVCAMGGMARSAEMPAMAANIRRVEPWRIRALDTGAIRQDMRSQRGSAPSE